MAATANEVSTNGLVDTKQSRPARRRDWPEELKHQMVAETLEAGSSVSIVARRHDVNTNQLFNWRREMLPKESSPAEALDVHAARASPIAKEALDRIGTLYVQQ